MATKKLDTATPATLAAAAPVKAPNTKEVPPTEDAKSSAARAIMAAYSSGQDDSQSVEVEKRTYDLFVAAANAVSAATPGHPMAATLRQTAEYRASRMRAKADQAVKDAKAYQKEVEEAFGTGEAAVAETTSWAKQQQLQPFFSTFLENQNAFASATASGPKPTLKYPSDQDEWVTMKYPSDDDEWRGSWAASQQLRKPPKVKAPPFYTLKYPSDQDEEPIRWDSQAPAATTQWPADDDEINVVPDELYAPQLVEGMEQPARTHRWPSEDDEYVPTDEDIAEMQRTLDDMWKQE